ncbi:30S ribosomal protein S18 [Candidatus Microgenomates bacterium]|nr:30S ribosomal protein S18 [Candidatus Microgenomates bacterium]
MARQRRQECPFCGTDSNPYFGDIGTLEKFLTDRGKIVGRKRTWTCSKHQRQLTREIKRARFLGLLPYVQHV